MGKSPTVKAVAKVPQKAAKGGAGDPLPKRATRSKAPEPNAEGNDKLVPVYAGENGRKLLGTYDVESEMVVTEVHSCAPHPPFPSSCALPVCGRLAAYPV
jgi:hypothetical protein